MKRKAADELTRPLPTVATTIYTFQSDSSSLFDCIPPDLALPAEWLVESSDGSEDHLLSDVESLERRFSQGSEDMSSLASTPATDITMAQLMQRATPKVVKKKLDFAMNQPVEPRLSSRELSWFSSAESDDSITSAPMFMQLPLPKRESNVMFECNLWVYR